MLDKLMCFMKKVSENNSSHCHQENVFELSDLTRIIRKFKKFLNKL